MWKLAGIKIPKYSQSCIYNYFMSSTFLITYGKLLFNMTKGFTGALFGGAIIRDLCVAHEDWLSFKKCLHKFTLLKRIIGAVPSGENSTSCRCIHPHCLLSHSTSPR